MKKLFVLVAVAAFGCTLASAETIEPQTSLQFDGANSIDCGVNTAFTNVDAFTVEAWVNYDAITGDGGYIASTETKVDGVRAGWVLKVEGGVFRIKIGDPSSWPGAASRSTVELNKWYHVAGTYDGTHLNLYINGVLDGTTAISTPMNYGVASMVLGNGTISYSNRWLQGKLADVRFWNVARTAEEIAAKRTPGSLTGTETGLVANWKMNEGIGANVADATGKFTQAIDPQAITWSATATKLQNIKNSKDIDALVSGQSVTVANNSKSALSVTVFNMTGAKVSSFKVEAGDSSVKELKGLNGVYFLNGITESGDQLIKKVLFN